MLNDTSNKAGVITTFVFSALVDKRASAMIRRTQAEGTETTVYRRRVLTTTQRYTTAEVLRLMSINSPDASNDYALEIPRH